jgi:hypothetical protein
MKMSTTPPSGAMSDSSNTSCGNSVLFRLTALPRLSRACLLSHLPMTVQLEAFLMATLDMRCALYDAAKTITLDGRIATTIHEVDLEKLEGPIVDLSTSERAMTHIQDEDRAHEAHVRSEILLRPGAAAAACTGRRWTVKSAHRKHTKLLLVKGTDRSPQNHPPIVVFGNFERWIEDFEANFRTSNDVSQLLRSLLESG